MAGKAQGNIAGFSWAFPPGVIKGAFPSIYTEDSFKPVPTGQVLAVTPPVFQDEETGA